MFNRAFYHSFFTEVLLYCLFALPEPHEAGDMLFLVYHLVLSSPSIAAATSPLVTIAMFFFGVLQRSLIANPQIVAYIDTFERFVPSGGLGILPAPLGKRPAQSDQLNLSPSLQVSFFDGRFP